MSEVDDVEQGTIRPSLNLTPETRQHVPSTAVPGNGTDQNISGNSGSRSGSQSIPNSHASRSTASSQQSTPPGWPTIASKQSRMINTGNLRHFDLLKRRVLLDLQTKTWSLGKLLQSMDQDDAQDDTSRLEKLLFKSHHLANLNCRAAVPRTESPSPHQDSRSPDSDHSDQANGQTPNPYPSATCSCVQDPKDKVMEALKKTLTDYYFLLLLSSQVEALPKVSQYAYENFRNFVDDDLPDGSDAWHALLDEPQDFITTRTSGLDIELEWLEWLFLRGKSRFGFAKLLKRVFRHRNESDNKHSYILTNFFETGIKIAVGAFCIATLAAPVGILLLVPLSDIESFGIVMIFSMVVVVGLGIRLRSFDTAFVAFSTYTAVLVTSLSNLYQARSH